METKLLSPFSYWLVELEIKHVGPGSKVSMLKFYFRSGSVEKEVLLFGALSENYV
jgi:hypothetical protein